ncbi:Homoserine/homoserine lactone efflux protein [Pelagimonas phthalicica]|uniref:Homoserine/homoserine lactone efflux protein n=1 Tax=Pelagimonas phthalicica TaxID=1037362 RepID=A0A238J5G1_9RHOB|nr:LysE family translocator [Pelagimonas phthalicica]TDS95527.1 threonine/homoserine/homoserine lactone efflux protein [Pelagimonas phthalicica]SMX25950.1 Homoserine/homoserine lactone efflux protein [Pelagimonas phthalicica]
MIPDPLVLLTFVPAALALNLTPGTDMMFCLAQGLRGGAKPGWAASAGISAGAFAHTFLAGIGLGALVAAHPAAFDVIRWAGVAYLLFLAWKTLRSPIGAASAKALTASQAAWQGFAVNLTNPKVILFFLAFVPQFIDPTRAVLPQFMFFGAVMALGGLIVNGLVGQFAGQLRGYLKAGSLSEKITRWVSATVFGALAARLALKA